MTSSLSSVVGALAAFCGEQDQSSRCSLLRAITYFSLVEQHPRRLSVRELADFTSLEPASIKSAVKGLLTIPAYARPRLLITEDMEANGDLTYGLSPAGENVRRRLIGARVARA